MAGVCDLSKDTWIGGHLSAATGLRHVVVNARALAYNVVQTMVGDGRGYQPYDISSEDVLEFRKMSFGIQLFVHLPYIINPCEEAPQRKGFYKRTFRQYMQTAAGLGARGVVLHPGFKKDLDITVAYRNLLKFIEDVMEDDETVDLLLETDAGSKNGSAVGSATLIGRAVKDLDHKKVGMCLDTCHMYARGINLWEPDWLKDILHQHHHIIRLIHLNVPDPEVSLGSHLDRHNTPFEERKDLPHENLIRVLVTRYPCVLERRSLSVQEKDIRFIRKILEKAPAPEG